MLRDIKKVSDKVESILKLYPETRDNDKLLWLSVMVRYYNFKNATKNYVEFKNWFLNNNVPAQESITRARRKIQEAGKYRGTIYESRHEEAELVRDWARQ